MTKIIVPLGGGCDIGIVLDSYNLRKISLPFDWLWNLEGGLSDVALIIESDFDKVKSLEDYIYTKHAVWTKKETLVFKHYPQIAHLHSNPYENPADLEALNRRIDRFQNLLNNNFQKLKFAYYRNVKTESDWNLQGCLNNFTKLNEESLHFLDMMENKYQGNSCQLLSILALPEQIYQNSDIVSSLQNLCKPKSSRKNRYEIAPMRDDQYPEQFGHWKNQWYLTFRRAGYISWLDATKIKYHTRLNSFKNSINKRKNALKTKNKRPK